MEGFVNLYQVSSEVSEKIFFAIENFNRGRRNDNGHYAIAAATSFRPNYSLWRIFSDTSFPPLFIKTLALNLDDAVMRAMEYIKNCDVSLLVLDNSYFEPYYNLPDDIVSFGKYRGKKLWEIYYIDPAYLYWLANKFEPRSKKNEKLILLAKGFCTVHYEVTVQKRFLASASQFIAEKGTKLADFELTVLSVRLQVDTYKKDFYVDQNVLGADIYGNRFSFVVKAAARSLAPSVLSCYSRTILSKEVLRIHSAKVLSHYQSKGIKYTRLGYVKFT